MCTQVTEKHQQLSFQGRRLASGLQLKDYDICGGSTLLLDAPLRRGKDVPDEVADVYDRECGGTALDIIDNQRHQIDLELEGFASYHFWNAPKPSTVDESMQFADLDQLALSDLNPIHFSSQPSRWAVDDHPKNTHGPSPLNPKTPTGPRR